MIRNPFRFYDVPPPPPTYSTKSFIQFPSDEEAQWFAKNYKKGTAVLPKKQNAGEWMGNKLDKQGLITYKTKGDNYIARVANSIDGDQYINRMIDSGKFGYDPYTSALVLLEKPSSGVSKESTFYTSPIYKELTAPTGKRKGEEGFLNRNQQKLFDSLPEWQQDIVEEHNMPLRKKWIEKSYADMYHNPLSYTPGMVGMGMLPLGFASAYGLLSSLGNLTQGNYKTAALEAGLSALPFAPKAFKLNPRALKQPDVLLTRTQKPGQTADLARLDELLQKQKLTKAEEIELVKLSQPGYGRGFDSNPNSINYYANPNIQRTRNYSGLPEIRVTSLSAEEAAKFNVGKNPVKDYFSFKKDKEFLLPRNYVEASESFMPKTFEELEQLRRALDAEQTALSTPHWWRGYPSAPKQLPGSGNVAPAVNTASAPWSMQELPLRNALKLKPTSAYTQPLASNNVDLKKYSNLRSIWDRLFNIKRPEQFLPKPLNAEDELARANADALAFSQSPYNRAKLQRFRQGQDFDVTNTEALFSNDPLARKRFDKLMKDDPNFLNYKNIENWQGAAEGSYGAKNFGDMDDLATVNKGIPQSKIYDAAIHETGHSRSVRLPATVEERAILDDAWKPLQEPNGSPVPFLEAEAVQGELRMMLGDKLGKRVYTQKDAGEIKKALEKMVANDHPYVHIRNINDFDIPKIIKSLNEIGLAGFAGGVVAPKLLKNEKKEKK